MSRTITITIDDSGFKVQEGDRYHDRLTWDEMLGLVVSITHPQLGKAQYRMATAEEWAEWERR